MTRALLIVILGSVLIATFARTLGPAATLTALFVLAYVAAPFWPLEADDETQ